MQTYTITVLVNRVESKVLVWKTIPRVGEIVVLGNEQEHRVTNVIHNFRRGVDSMNGEITLEVLPIRVKTTTLEPGPVTSANP